ncbi:MAG: toll/interleukin-1 receptor domain-containing protein [Myxococcales bacterium]
MAAKKVFLSYASDDRAVARKIADQLRQAKLYVWDVEDELEPGDDWHRTTSEALSTSDAMVVVLSPKSVRSQ